MREKRKLGDKFGFVNAYYGVYYSPTQKLSANFNDMADRFDKQIRLLNSAKPAIEKTFRRAVYEMTLKYPDFSITLSRCEVKSFNRCVIKIFTDYNTDYQQIKDLVRCKCVVNSSNTNAAYEFANRVPELMKEWITSYDLIGAHGHECYCKDLNVAGVEYWAMILCGCFEVQVIPKQYVSVGPANHKAYRAQRGQAAHRKLREMIDYQKAPEVADLLRYVDDYNADWSR
eukprot:c4055_g1_i1.p1 GENE.c4055_g1_i1~~c4055_g1_i1.p1  ORF type:complete len:268 (-),score=40.91 c4055_g1_i1:42-728(-)